MKEVKRFTLETTILTEAQIREARNKGFVHILYDNDRKSKLRNEYMWIWPHIDGWISAILKNGQLAKHKKFREFEAALARRLTE